MLRCSLLVAAAAILLAACGAPPGPSRQEVPAPDVTSAQRQQLVDAERAWRQESEELDRLQHELLAEPATAWWWTRMLVHDYVSLLDQRQVDDRTIYENVTGTPNAKLERVRARIVGLGAAAAPCLIHDLLRGPYPDRTLVAQQFLASIGPSVLSALAPTLGDPEPRLRRVAVEAVAAMPAGADVTAVLLRGAGDEDFTVRAAAYTGLARSPEHAGLLREAVRNDDDAFVRRTIVQNIAGFRDRETASAVVAYLERCVRDGDSRGAEAATATLQRMAGKNARDVAGWRNWAAALPAEGRF